ncbi:MAG: acetyl ornithine aminotransferase family protein [Nitrososphaerota archaeon]|nr:acetyl ornithine aminotransferase family protein [Nitrososphaerota archaeon]
MPQTSARSVRGRVPGPRARAVIKRTDRIIAPSISRDDPLVVESAHGSVVTDVDGNRFLDFSSGIAVLSTGSTHPKVVEAAKRQLERFIHFSYTDFYYENLVTLAEELCELAPGEGQKMVYWGNSGAEANEAAMKLARNYTKRPLFLAHSGGFHGRTMGALSLTGSKPVQRKGALPLVPEVVHFPFPYCYRCPWRQTFPECDYYCIDYFKEQYLEKFVPVQEVAAYFFEPFQGEGGYVLPPPEYFDKMSFLKKEGVLMVADEVQTGIGRSGKFFAVEHFGLEPDVISVAKGLASGMPLGGIVARADVMRSWVPGQHASTFGANPVAVEAALATLEVIRTERLIQNAERMGRVAMKRLEEMKERYEVVGDVRGKGLFIGVEVVKSKKTKRRGIEEAQAVTAECFKRGLILITAGMNTLRVIPPLNVSREELDDGLDVIEKALGQVNSGA